MRKLVNQLSRGARLVAAYEAGPTGYTLHRQLTSLGVECQVVAPSLVPRRAGDRVKTDSRDALALARLLRNGDLTPVWVPDPEHEALRDLVRARYDAKVDLLRARHRLTKFLLRQGVYPPQGVKHWTVRHQAWLSQLSLPQAPAQVVLEDYLASMHLRAVRKAAPSTINNTLAPLDDFFAHRGLGAAAARHEDLPQPDAPRALGEREARRYLRIVERKASARDRAVGLLPNHAGLRDSEVVGVDVGDVRLSPARASSGCWVRARTGASSAPSRSTPSSGRRSRAGLRSADAIPAIVHSRGGRLSDRSVSSIIGRFGELASLDDDPLDPFGPHVLRHTFGTQLVRAGVDLVTVAELMGHAPLETTRIYTLPTRAHRERALDALLTDR